MKRLICVVLAIILATTAIVTTYAAESNADNTDNEPQEYIDLYFKCDDVVMSETDMIYMVSRSEKYGWYSEIAEEAEHNLYRAKIFKDAEGFQIYGYKLHSESTFSTDYYYDETIGYNGLENRVCLVTDYPKPAGWWLTKLETELDYINPTNYEISKIPFDSQKGDVNGDIKVNAQDIFLVQQRVSEKKELDNNQNNTADYNSDGSINLLDCTQMQNVLAEK